MVHSRKKVRHCTRAVSLLLSAVSAVAVVHAADQSDETATGADAATKSKVEAALRADKVLLSKHINVSVKQGEVRLGGFVEKQTDVDRAKKDAQSVSGVKTVKNEMTLKPGSEESSTSGGN